MEGVGIKQEGCEIKVLYEESRLGRDLEKLVYHFVSSLRQKDRRCLFALESDGATGYGLLRKPNLLHKGLVIPHQPFFIHHARFIPVADGDHTQLVGFACGGNGFAISNRHGL